MRLRLKHTNKNNFTSNDFSLFDDMNGADYNFGGDPNKTLIGKTYAKEMFTPGGYTPFKLDIPFYWDGNSNVILEYSRDSYYNLDKGDKGGTFLLEKNGVDLKDRCITKYKNGEIFIENTIISIYILLKI